MLVSDDFARKVHQHPRWNSLAHGAQGAPHAQGRGQASFQVQITRALLARHRNERFQIHA